MSTTTKLDATVLGCVLPAPGNLMVACQIGIIHAPDDGLGPWRLLDLQQVDQAPTHDRMTAWMTAAARHSRNTSRTGCQRIVIEAHDSAPALSEDAGSQLRRALNGTVPVKVIALRDDGGADFAARGAATAEALRDLTAAADMWLQRRMLVLGDAPDAQRIADALTAYTRRPLVTRDTERGGPRKDTDSLLLALAAAIHAVSGAPVCNLSGSTWARTSDPWLYRRISDDHRRQMHEAAVEDRTADPRRARLLEEIAGRGWCVFPPNRGLPWYLGRIGLRAAGHTPAPAAQHPASPVRIDDVASAAAAATGIARGSLDSGDRAAAERQRQEQA